MNQPVQIRTKTENIRVFVTGALTGYKDRKMRDDILCCQWGFLILTRWQCSVGIWLEKFLMTSFRNFFNYFQLSSDFACACLTKTNCYIEQKNNCSEFWQPGGICAWDILINVSSSFNHVLWPRWVCSWLARSCGCGSVIAEKLRKWMFYQPVQRQQHQHRGEERQISKFNSSVTANSNKNSQWTISCWFLFQNIWIFVSPIMAVCISMS